MAVVGYVATAVESCWPVWLAAAILKPLTGTANMVTGDVNTVVTETIVPESIPEYHDSVWPSVSLEVQ